MPVHCLRMVLSLRLRDCLTARPTYQHFSPLMSQRPTSHPLSSSVPRHYLSSYLTSYSYIVVFPAPHFHYKIEVDRPAPSGRARHPESVWESWVWKCGNNNVPKSEMNSKTNDTGCVVLIFLRYSIQSSVTFDIIFRSLRAKLNPIHPLHKANQKVFVGKAWRLKSTVMLLDMYNICMKDFPLKFSLAFRNSKSHKWVRSGDYGRWGSAGCFATSGNCFQVKHCAQCSHCTLCSAGHSSLMSSLIRWWVFM